MRHKLIILLLILVFPGILSGCWDVEEINQKATVNAIFLDTGQPGNIRLGASFEVPGTLLPPYGGSEQQFQKRTFTLAGEGPGLLDAWKNLQSISARDIFFGQIIAIIITEKLAMSSDLNEILNFIGRTMEFPGNTFVLVTRDDPEQLLDIKLKNNMLPGNYIRNYYQSPSRQNLAIPIQLWQVFYALTNRTNDLYLPMIETSQGMYRIAGTALFSGPRMVGKLDEQETEVLSLLLGTQDGYLTVASGRQLLGFFHVQSKSSIKPRMNAGRKWEFTVNTKISGSLHENRPADLNLTPKIIRNYQKQAKDYTGREIKKLLDKLVQLNSDPVGFGDRIRIKYPEVWEKNDWRQIYPEVKFGIKTEFVNKTTGVFR
ncbi:MAG TPA: Ger(x)C family spore germination protein [Bacillota bacterium]|nr:Ger(x)C family spore germination protein [Bacillota bacterium]